MKFPITMPQMGLTMTEGTVGPWLKKPGDSIEKDEIVLSISTDKADVDVESPVGGVLLEILAEPGATVPVGAELAFVQVADQSASGFSPAVTQPVLSADEESADRPSTAGHRIGADSTGPRQRMSPRARKLAQKMNIDPGALRGSGPDGLITEKDLAQIASPSPAAQPAENHARWRQAIAERMLQSVRTIPAFTLSLEVDATRLAEFNEARKHRASGHSGVYATYTDLLLKAIAIALSENPDMNAVWIDGQVHPQTQVNLGFAVSTERGVIAPVLTDVASLPLADLALRRSRLTEKSRQNKLAPADCDGGVGTLSNLGMFRVDRFEGIIPPGQSFLLSTGSLRSRPWAAGSSLSVRPTLILTLSVDHRVADGAPAARLIEQIGSLIETSDYLRSAE